MAWRGSLLAGVDWSAVNAAVAQEQTNRERNTPTISLFRWWARRPHALIGAILDSAVAASHRMPLQVSDPFSGGGTVAIEASIRSLSVYSQDLFFWPTFALRTSLCDTDPEELFHASKDLLRSIQYLRKAYRGSDGRELTHVLRVRTGVCPACVQQVFLFPEPFVSLASRSAGESEGFYGCVACGHVFRNVINRHPSKCPICLSILSRPYRGKPLLTCPHCSHRAVQSDFIRHPITWKPVLVQEAVAGDGRVRALLRVAVPEDPTGSPFASKVFRELREPIKEGVETHRLLLAGFQSWGDLYTNRQARVVLTAIEHIKAMKVSRSCKDRLALAVLGFAEMPAFLSRWDRYHLKAYEGLANHRYAHTTLVVETNPLAPIGRGTLPRRLHAACRALDWIRERIPRKSRRVCSVTRSQTARIGHGAWIATGDSSRQGLASASIHLVLTDPPYFDDVQYGELARLYHFWLARFRRVPRIVERKEAVPNTQRKHGADFYEAAIARCFQECDRTLCKKGRLILTFHNQKFLAWQALGRALLQAGFRIRAVAVARAENGSDLTKRDGRGLLHDVVLECERRSRGRVAVGVAVAGKSDEERSLLAMGLALREALGRCTPDRLPELYRLQLKRLRVKRASIVCGETRSGNTPSARARSRMLS